MYNWFVVILTVYSVLSEGYPAVNVLTRDNYIVINHHYLNKSIYTGKEYFELENILHEKTTQVNRLFSDNSIEFLLGSLTLSPDRLTNDSVDVFWTLNNCPYVDYENAAIHLCHNDTFGELANELQSLLPYVKPLFLKVNISAIIEGDTLFINGNTNQSPLFWTVFVKDKQIGSGYSQIFEFSTILMENDVNYSYLVSVCYDYEYANYVGFCYEAVIDNVHKDISVASTINRLTSWIMLLVVFIYIII
jgi:hypothetical protein